MSTNYEMGVDLDIEQPPITPPPSRRKSLSNFVIQEKLGKGWLGTVYSAIDTASNYEECAIKMLSKRRIEREDAEEHIRDEIQINASLNHENIVRMVDSFEDKRHIYIVMEKCQSDLASYLVKQPNHYLDEDDAMKHFVQLLDAIDYLHQLNIYHRDIKPENVLRSSDGKVKLCDFGFAAQSSRRRETLCGTAEYMAPEMVSREPYRHKIDIWSLGCLLYELVTGQVPFGERDDGAGRVECETANECGEFHTLYHRILERPITFPRHVSGRVRDLIRLMLDKVPSHRPSTSELQKHPLVLEAHRSLDSERSETAIRRSLDEHNIIDCSVEVERVSGDAVECVSAATSCRIPPTPATASSTSNTGDRQDSGDRGVLCVLSPQQQQPERLQTNTRNTRQAAAATSPPAAAASSENNKNTGGKKQQARGMAKSKRKRAVTAAEDKENAAPPPQSGAAASSGGKRQREAAEPCNNAQVGRYNLRSRGPVRG